MKASGFMLLGVLLLAASAGAGEAEVVTWPDDFEAYPAMSSPTSGGWVIRYGGAGTEQQYVDTSYAAAGEQSLHLMGSSCWSANVYHELPGLCDSCEVSYEGRIRVESVVGGGCTPILARIGFENPSVGYWGSEYASVIFESDGWIHADTSASATAAPSLIPYETGRWYSVLVVASFRTRRFDVHIDGVLRAEGLPIRVDGSATGIEICAGHGNPGPVAWFDEIVATYGTSKELTAVRPRTWGQLKALYR